MPATNLHYKAQDDMDQITKILTLRKPLRFLLEIFEQTTNHPLYLQHLLLQKTNKFWRPIVDARDPRNNNILMLILHFHADSPENFELFLNFLTKNKKRISNNLLETLLTEKNDDKKNILELVEKNSTLFPCLLKFIMHHELKIEDWTKKILSNEAFNASNKYLFAHYCAKNLTDSELKKLTTAEQRKQLRKFGAIK